MIFIIYAILLIRYISLHKNPGKPVENPSTFTFSHQKRSHSKIDGILLDFNDWNDVLSIDSLKSANFSNQNSISINKKLEIVDDKYFLELTKEDKMIITKLLIMTTISGISGLLIIAIGTPFTLSDDLNEPTYAYIGMFLAFFLEFSICILIIKAFTTHIKIPAKENIKKMACMARVIRKTEPELKISSRFKHITRRLYIYYI